MIPNASGLNPKGDLYAFKPIKTISRVQIVRELLRSYEVWQQFFFFHAAINGWRSRGGRDTDEL